MLGAEFRSEPPDVDIDGARTAEVVVAPDLLKEDRASEDAPGVLGQELEQLELLEGEVKGAAAEFGGVRGLVDHQLATANLLRLGFRGAERVAHARAGKPQPGLNLSGGRRVDENLVHSPVPLDCRQTPLRGDEDERHIHTGLAQEAGQSSHGRQVAAAIDDEDVAVGGIEKGSRLGRERADVVGEEAEGWKHFGGRFHRASEQDDPHGCLPRVVVPSGVTASRCPVRRHDDVRNDCSVERRQSTRANRTPRRAFTRVLGVRMTTRR